MIERVPGRAWHGDHLIDAATAGDVAGLLAVEDGVATEGGLVYRVHEFTADLGGAVLIHGFDQYVPRKGPVDSPLGHLADAPTVEVTKDISATVRVVSMTAPENPEDLDRLFRAMLLRSGVVLATVRWGDPVDWVPAEPSRGAAAAAARSAFMLALAPHDRVIPSLSSTRGWLAEEGVAPGGERGQRLREGGETWRGVPTVSSWDDDASDVWVLGALLERAMNRTGEGRSTIFSARAPQMTTLVPGGASVLIAPLGIGFSLGAHDGLLTLWEGKDSAGLTVGVAVHRSAADMPSVALPLWPGQRPSDPPDGWSGEVMEYEDADGYLERYRLRATPVGRLMFPSRRIVASDPCVAGRSPVLDLVLPSEGPFAILRTDLVDVTDDGTELDGQARGILLVIDERCSPVRWEAARDVSDVPIDCAIDSGQLLLADADGANVVQQEYDDGTVDYAASSRLVLRRSDPFRPADIAILGDLSGDGPAWVVVGRAEDGRPVAVMVSNFNPLS